MRYLLRTHRCSVAWLHETFMAEDKRLIYEQSSRMCADIYTETFTDTLKWRHACWLINVVDPVLLRKFRIEISTQTLTTTGESEKAGHPTAPGARDKSGSPDGQDITINIYGRSGTPDGLTKSAAAKTQDRTLSVGRLGTPSNGSITANVPPVFAHIDSSCKAVPGCTFQVTSEFCSRVACLINGLTIPESSRSASVTRGGHRLHVGAVGLPRTYVYGESDVSINTFLIFVNTAVKTVFGASFRLEFRDYRNGKGIQGSCVPG